MSFPRYPKYKDSGVEWLGEVPEHWKAGRLRFLCECLDGRRIPLNAAQRGDKRGDVPYWGANSVVDYVDEALFDEELVLLGEDGAPFFESTKPVAFLVRGKVWPNNHVHVLRPRNPGTGQFITHVLNATDYSQFIDGSTRDKLTQDAMNDIPVPWPPLPEQVQISAFLGRETAKIDELVEEQSRLISLLQEKRQAVISHAVTKGLNPAAPMKPSGVEWLGDVPEHWELAPLKHVVRMRSGGTPDKATLNFWNGSIPWASSKDLKREELDDTEDHITQRAIDDNAAALIHSSSLLIVVRGMILAHTFPVVKTLVPMAINQDLKALIPSRRFVVDFLAWLLRGTSAETLGRVDEAGHGTKVLRLEAWTSLVLPIPPRNEQDEIVAGIVERLLELDTLTTEAQHAITLLLERRAALISAAVTGQIDVRSVVAA